MDTQQIVVLLTEVVRLVESARDELTGPEVVVGPYAGAMNFRFTNTYNGNMSRADFEPYEARWRDWVIANQPETAEMHKLLPKEQRRTTVWVPRGGLHIQSMSPADEFFSEEVQGMASNEAAAKALEARKNATPPWRGWPRYLTAPNGTQKGRSGQYYGPYTRPGDEEEPSPFNPSVG